MKTPILVVDDEPTHILMVSQLLKEDYRVIAATSGEQALERLAANPDIALVLMDLNMEGMSGIDATQVIKANTSTQALPVLLLATPSEEELTQAFAAGVWDIIEKPIQPPLLQQRIKNALA